MAQMTSILPSIQMDDAERQRRRRTRSSSSSCSLNSHGDAEVQQRSEIGEEERSTDAQFHDIFGSESDDEPAASRVEAAKTTDVAEGVAPERVRILPSQLEAPVEGFPEDEAVPAEFELGGPMELKFPVERVRHSTDAVAFFAPGEFLDVDLQYFESAVSEDFVENGIISKRVIRWRKNDNGDIESNTRLVEWDDGTFSFYVEGKWYDLGKESFAQGTELLCIDQQNCLQALHAVSGGFYTVAVPSDESDDESEAQIVVADAVHTHRGPKTKRVTVLGNPLKEQEAKLRKIQEERRDRELMERRQKSLQEKYTLPRMDHLGEDEEETGSTKRKQSRPHRRQPGRSKKIRVSDYEDEILEEDEEEEIRSADLGEEEEMLSTENEEVSEEEEEKAEPEEEETKSSEEDVPDATEPTQESSDRQVDHNFTHIPHTTSPQERKDGARGPRVILLTDDEDEDISDG